VWYFAYGSNLCRARLLARIASARYQMVGRLPGHDLRFHKRGRDGSGKADAFRTESGDDAVWDALIRIDPAQVPELDRHEPDYERRVRPIEVPSAGTSYEAHTYVALPPVRDPSLRPFAWYRDMVVEGGTARGLPANYLDRMARTAVRADALRRLDPGPC